MITRNKIKNSFLSNLEQYGKLIRLPENVCDVIALETQIEINENFKEKITNIQYVACYSPEINILSLLMLFKNKNKKQSFTIQHGHMENGKDFIDDEYGMCLVSQIKKDEKLNEAFEIALKRYQQKISYNWNN